MSENSDRKNDGDKNLSKGSKGVRGDADITNVGDTARDITNADDISKVVSSGTSLTKPERIDKTDIYSTSDDGTRDIEGAQEKPVTKVEDKEKGTWKIKED